MPEHRDGGLPHLGFFIVAEGQVEYHLSSKRRRGLRSERLDRHEIARPGGALVVNNLLPFKELRPLHKSTNGSGARVGMRFLAHS